MPEATATIPPWELNVNHMAAHATGLAMENATEIAKSQSMVAQAIAAAAADKVANLDPEHAKASTGVLTGHAASNDLVSLGAMIAGLRGMLNTSAGAPNPS